VRNKYGVVEAIIKSREQNPWHPRDDVKKLKSQLAVIKGKLDNADAFFKEVSSDVKYHLPAEVTTTH